MDNKIDYNEIINRMGYFMNKANLSARAVSLKLDYSEQFMKRILNKSVELKVGKTIKYIKNWDGATW